jgi:EAL domain-containing protein (putative c-di-GMP-specific phosphodiesterase class I)
MAVVASVLKVLAADVGRDASIAANISARSLGSERFVIELAWLCGDTAALRPRLLLELTETHQITDFDQVNGALAQLRRLGHKVCLDDFGAGACSLEYLRRLDVDYVKIDGRYVQELAAGSRDAMILKHVVGLCDEMGVPTIAEMIETRQAAGICKDLGVTLGQGWVFSKPLPKPVWIPPAPTAPSIRGRRNGKVETWG